MAGKHRGGGLRELFRRRPGPGPRTPHGLYVRNDAGFKHLTDNIVFDNLGNGFHCYASSKVAVRNLVVEGNAVFNNGGIANASSASDNLLFAGGRWSGGELPRVGRRRGDHADAGHRSDAPFGRCRPCRARETAESRSLAGALNILLTARYVPLGVPKWFWVSLPGLAACARGILLALACAIVPDDCAVRAARLSRGAIRRRKAARWPPWASARWHANALRRQRLQIRPRDTPVQPAIPLPAVLAASARRRTTGPDLRGTAPGRRPCLRAGRRLGPNCAGRRRPARRLRTSRGARFADPAGLRAGPGRFHACRDGFPHRRPSKLEGPHLRLGGRATGVQVLRQRDREDPFTTAGEARLEDLASGSRLVAFAYSSTLRRIYRRAPDALEQVDATVILNLDELRRSADKITVGATGRRS